MVRNCEAVRFVWRLAGVLTATLGSGRFGLGADSKGGDRCEA